MPSILSMLEKDDIGDLLGTALAFYSTKLERLKKESESGSKDSFQLEKNLLQDIESKVIEINNLKEEIAKHPLANFPDFLKSKRKTVCEALSIYSRDLCLEKNQFYEKLGAEPSLFNLESQIRKAKDLKEDLCS